MTKRPDANAFLARLNASPDMDETPPPHSTAPAEPPKPQQEAELHMLPPPAPTRTRKAAAKARPRRAELKHFGGYLDDDTLEKIALLRIRLKKDNSELITFAIEELHRKHNAKRAFGDI